MTNWTWIKGISDNSIVLKSTKVNPCTGSNVGIGTKANLCNRTSQIRKEKVTASKIKQTTTNYSDQTLKWQCNEQKTKYTLNHWIKLWLFQWKDRKEMVSQS